MCDAFLVLAQAEGGLSCFFMPRFTPDGERNPIHIQRLKDKLGNRSNASSEVEFRGTWARMVGEEGRGVPTIIEMVNHTRLDCCLGAAAGMRAAVANAIHHTSQRAAFGKLLIDQPLMRNVLADLAIESEAATIGAMRLARAYDQSIAGDERGDAVQADLQRGAQVLALQARRPPRRRGARVLRRQRLRRGVGDAAPVPRVAAELDLGGLGQRPVPRRAAGDGPRPGGARGVLRRGRRGGGRRPAPRRRGGARCATSSATSTEIEARARRVVERMALVLQGSLLVRFGDPAVADAFCASRLGGDWGRAFGTLPAGTDFGRIIERHTPAV